MSIVQTTGYMYTRDLGYNRIMHNLLKSEYTRVGFPLGGHTSGEKTYPEVVKVGYKNEFGIGKSNPERSFIRSSVDEKANQLMMTMRKSVRKVTGGFSTLRKEAKQLGAISEVLIKQKIQEGGTPYKSNSPGTVKHKGRNSPLIDTGQLQNTIQHVETSKRRGKI